MIEGLKNWISSIIVMILFVTLVEILIPEGRMRKYVGFITGILVIIAIVAPVMKIIGGEVRFDIPEVENFERMEQNMIEKNGEALSRIQISQIMMVYKDKLEKSIRDLLKDIKDVKYMNIECDVYKDNKDPKFGEIEQIRIYLELPTLRNTAKEMGSIEIKINPEQKDDNKYKEEIKNEIVKRITSTYKVQPSQIKIVWK